MSKLPKYNLRYSANRNCLHEANKFLKCESYKSVAKKIKEKIDDRV